MLVWEGLKRRSLWGLGGFDACMRKIQAQEWVRFVQVWCKLEKDSDAGVGGVCAGLMRVWEGFRRRSGGSLCRFDACMRRIQTQEWVRFVQVLCKHEKDSDAGVADVCAELVQVWEGFRHRSGWGLCRFDARMIRIQTQEGERFVQVWCMHDKDSDAGVGDVCACLCMRRIQTQEWLCFVHVWCLSEKDSDARVGEVCAGLMLLWEGFRRTSGWGLCRIDACMRRIQTREWVMLLHVCAWEGFRRKSGCVLCMFDACLRRIQTQEWARFVQVWCFYEKDSDARADEVCAELMRVWEGFRHGSGWCFCMFYASMRMIQTQETVRFTQVWCFCEKGSDARVVGEVCAGLMLLREGFRRRSGWGLCTLEACVRRIKTQEWVRFVQVWCVYEKDSDAGVGEVCAGSMLVWEGFKRRSLWGLCRFDACMRNIQAQEWVRFVQVWFKHEKDSDPRVGEVCAGLIQAWEGFWCKSGWGLCRFDAFYEKDSEAGLGLVCAGLILVWEGLRRRSLWGFCRFDACMRKIQAQEWVRFVQVWCKHEKDSDAGVGGVCAGLMRVWEGFRRRSGGGLCRFDACMRRIQTQEFARFVQVWCVYEKDSGAGVGEVCAGLIQAWEGFWPKSRWGLCRFDSSMRRILMQEWVRFVQVWCFLWEGFRSRIGSGLCRFDTCMRRIKTQEFVRFLQVWCVYEKDSGAGVGEVCAGLMQTWEGFRRRSGWGLCRFDACMRRIQTQEWGRFVQVWCLYEKDSDAGVCEVWAGLMRVWERFRRRSGWGLCRFDASMRMIQAQEWVRFVQVWFKHEKDSDPRVGEVCAGLIQEWEGFWCKSGWGLCRFDACMRRIQTQDWVRFVQVWCVNEKDSGTWVREVCVCLMQEWEGFRRRSGWGLCRFDACMRRIQTQEWVRFVQVWCLYEKDSDAGVCEVWAGLMRLWERFRRRSEWGLCRFDSSMRRILTQE